MFPKAPPLVPPTMDQLAQQSKFIEAAAFWKQQTLATRRKWERAAKLSKIRITGYNLWIVAMTQFRKGYVQTIEHQTGIQLFPIGS